MGWIPFVDRFLLTRMVPNITIKMRTMKMAKNAHLAPPPVVHESSPHDLLFTSVMCILSLRIGIFVSSQEPPLINHIFGRDHLLDFGTGTALTNFGYRKTESLGHGLQRHRGHNEVQDLFNRYGESLLLSWSPDNVWHYLLERWKFEIRGCNY